MRLLSRIARRAGIHAWQIFTRPLSTSAPVSPAGLVMRLMPPDEPAATWSDPELQVDARKAAEGFARGEVCVGAFDGATLAGYAWFAYRPAPHSEGIWMDFDSRAIYTYRAFVKPRYRGRGMAPALYVFADRLFLDNGREFAVLCIEATNGASVAAARRAGAQKAGYTAYWHRAGRLVAMRTPGVRRAGFRFYLPD